MDRDVNGAKNIFLRNYEALGDILGLQHWGLPLAERRPLSCTENLQLSCDNREIFCQILKFLRTLKFGVGVYK